MEIKNKRNGANYVNFKLGGFGKKTSIPAGKTVDIPEITDVSQIINYGDFSRGFFEIIYKEQKKIDSKEDSKEVSKEDYLDKVRKEVRDYTEKNNK